MAPQLAGNPNFVLRLTTARKSCFSISLRDPVGKTSLCANSVMLCVSVVKLLRRIFTTEAQRLHREPQREFLFPTTP